MPHGGHGGLLVDIPCIRPGLLIRPGGHWSSSVPESPSWTQWDMEQKHHPGGMVVVGKLPQKHTGAVVRLTAHKATLSGAGVFVPIALCLSC